MTIPALAETWNSTIWPSPTRRRVTSGVGQGRDGRLRKVRAAGQGSVPSPSHRGQLAKAVEGRGRKGGASAFGSPVIGAANGAPPILSRTGKSGRSSLLRPTSDEARCGPAKRTSSLPSSIQSSSASVSGTPPPASAMMITSGAAIKVVGGHRAFDQVGGGRQCLAQVVVGGQKLQPSCPVPALTIVTLRRFRASVGQGDGARGAFARDLAA
ncbi:MAG: hypothetical protein R3D46_02735 [Defluviimonas denitrificans]